MALRVAGAWSWRLIVVGIVLMAGLTMFSRLSAIMVPVLIAVGLAAPLERAVTWLSKRGVNRSGGAALVLGSLVIAVLGLLAAAGQSVVAGFDSLRLRAVDGLDTVVDWLAEGPLHVTRGQIDAYIDKASSAIEENGLGVVSGALSVTSTVGLLAAGVIIALFSLYFFLRDGRAMWLWGVRLFPADVQATVDGAGLRAWTTLRKYTETCVVVALVDSIGIGLAAWLLGVPLALPIAILVFLGSFIPVVGSGITGAIAVLVALVDRGWVVALIMLAAVLVVQQVEGSILYPWLFGRAASVHPIVILLTVSAGGLLAGLVGALLAVPTFAFIYAFIQGVKAQGENPPDRRAPITSSLPVIANQAKGAIGRLRPHRGTRSAPTLVAPDAAEVTDAPTE